MTERCPQLGHHAPATGDYAAEVQNFSFKDLPVAMLNSEIAPTCGNGDVFVGTQGSIPGKITTRCIFQYNWVQVLKCGFHE